MKRKVIQQGPSTLMVSIPNKWVKKHNIKKGDEIELNEKGNILELAIESKETDLSINIDITDLDRTSIMHSMRSNYRKGYSLINIYFKNQTTTHFRTGKKVSVISIIHKEASRLIGIEIIKQNENMVTIKDFSTSSIEDFDNSLRRIFLLILDLSKDFIKAIDNFDKILFSSIEEKHDTITKFVSYALRLLNKKGYKDPQKTSILYHIISCLDIITDIFKYAARDALELENKLKKQSKEIIKDIHNSLQWFYELFYKYSNQKALQINKNRDEVKTKIKNSMKSLPENENLLIANLEHILEIIWDLALARTGLKIN
jgi:phosphate uptake regulator